ncbi:unnamed protein product [Mytilus coruscus]|uniref:Uncharacterized protein n=1 Tax=Mytilus coruscus TaxID=42192 RepID=A0A6J8AXJ0_MYTCO|nr:unnamed protein product [Mytilus coruscus]
MSTKLDLEKDLISDGLLRDDGLIVLASFKKNVIITLNMNGSGIDFIPLEFSPWDITATDNTAVAITLPEAKRIEIYEITSKSKKVRTINLLYCCFKITSTENKLIVACNEGILLIVDLIRDGSVTIETPVSADDSLSSSGDRIYHSNYNGNTLTCYHDDGIKLYSVDMGEKPQGMTFIFDSRLLVLMKDGKLRLVSSNGYRYTHLEYEAHKLKDPRIISYNHKLKKLFIANRHGFFNIYIKDTLQVPVNMTGRVKDVESLATNNTHVRKMFTEEEQHTDKTYSVEIEEEDEKKHIRKKLGVNKITKATINEQRQTKFNMTNEIRKQHNY